MTILPGQEMVLLTAVIDRALRDAHGDVSGLWASSVERTVADARRFLEHVGLDWRTAAYAPKRGNERAFQWPDFHDGRDSFGERQLFRVTKL